MVRGLNFIIEKCTGCHQCEMVCSGVKEGIFSPDRSRIRIHALTDPSANIPYACFQCAEAWCMNSCPVQAISLDKSTGAKVLDDSICVVCKLCTIACPYGTVVYQQSSGKVVKCDLCHGYENGPACVGACPTNAIVILEDNPMNESAIQAAS